MHPANLERLVLGWINADFRVQIRVFQHFSKSTGKSSSREQILRISAKKVRNFAKKKIFFLANLKFSILQKIAKFKNFRNPQFFLQKFAEFFAESHRNL